MPKQDDDIGRDALRAALAEKRLAEAEVESACGALRRAADLFDSAEVELAHFMQVEAEVSNHDVEGIKAAIRAGHDASIPEMDAARVQVRVRLEARRAKAAQARGDIAKEHEAALARAKAAEVQVWRAAIEVVRLEASALADKLRAAQEHTWALNAKLAGVTSLWAGVPGERPKLIGLPPGVITVIDRIEPQYARSNDPRALASVEWRGFLAALVENAEACSPHATSDS